MEGSSKDLGGGGPHASNVVVATVVRLLLKISGLLGKNGLPLEFKFH